MEEIIVTYIKQSNEEIDIAIPNDVKVVQIIEAILHHEKIDEALSGIMKLEWQKIKKSGILFEMMKRYAIMMCGTDSM